MRKSPCNWSMENYLGRESGSWIAGVDEVGRGAFAGNFVVSACVYAPTASVSFPIHDSKALTHTEREDLVARLTRDYVENGLLYVAYAQAEPLVVERSNLNVLNLKLFKEALQQLPRFDQVIIDGAISDNTFAGITAPQADAISITVATASVFAKVHRDRQMRELHLRYPQYGFDRHVGYGSKDHIAAIVAHGPIPGVHRANFLRNLEMLRKIEGSLTPKCRFAG